MAQPGERLAIVNSFGVVELAQGQVTAQRQLAAQCGEWVSVREASVSAPPKASGVLA